MNKVMKGLQALRDTVSPPDADVLTDAELHGSISDGIAEAVRAANEAAEQSKPELPAAPPAPALLPTGFEAIRVAGEATEADRVREYALIAEIDAEYEALCSKRGGLSLKIIEANRVLSEAQSEDSEAHERQKALKEQRAETVDRIVALNQMTIDNEAARLRRG